MTKLLEQAFKEASKLPEEEQNALAEMLLNDLASERQWSDAFARSREKLALLAQEAIDEFRQGKTQRIEDEPCSHEPFHKSAKPIWEEFAELIDAAPKEYFEALPIDGSTRHDDYINGKTGKHG